MEFFEMKRLDEPAPDPRFGDPALEHHSPEEGWQLTSDRFGPRSVKWNENKRGAGFQYDQDRYSRDRRGGVPIQDNPEDEAVWCEIASRVQNVLKNS